MANNRFFVKALPNENMIQVFDIVVGSSMYQKISTDSKIMVKLPIEWSVEPLASQTPAILQNATEYTYEEWLVEQEKPEWNNTLWRQKI